MPFSLWKQWNGVLSFVSNFRLTAKHPEHPGSADSSAVRVPDSWLKGCGFESLQERRENFASPGSTFCADSLVRYPLHPRVTAVARKRYWSFCRKCRWQVTAKHACTLRMWLCAWSDMVHGCMVYSERAETAAVSCATSHVSAVSTPLRWILYIYI